jgi:hypothetical protein
MATDRNSAKGWDQNTDLRGAALPGIVRRPVDWCSARYLEPHGWWQRKANPLDAPAGAAQMIHATLLIVMAAVVAHIAQGVAYVLKHEAARRRAKRMVWPPIRVLEVQDDIPF